MQVICESQCTKCLEYVKVNDRQVEHTVLLEGSVICSVLCSELLQFCCVCTNGQSIVARY